MRVLLKKNLIISLLAISLVACASGSAIVTGTKRPPLEPSQVKLYTEPPAKYEVVAVVSASSDAGLTEQGSVGYAVQELKNQAANLGANGVILEATSERATKVFGGVAKTVKGKAIFVIEEDF